MIPTVDDHLEFGPIIRRFYNPPNSLSLALFATRNLIIIMALKNHTVATVLFPDAIAFA